jgi:hypothetical protein
MMTLAYGDNPFWRSRVQAPHHQDWGKASVVERIGKALHDSMAKKASLAATAKQPRLR